MKINKQRLFADLGYKPHPGQAAIHESTALRRVVACGARWGKTKAAAMECIAAALSPGKDAIGWVAAPNFDLTDRIFREIVQVVTRRIPHRIVQLKESERRILFRNLAGNVCEVRAKSAESLVSLLGEGLDFLVIDEAAQLRPSVWENYLSQRLIDKRGWALFISTPKGRNWFYEMYRRGQGRDADYASWNSPSWQNPFLGKDAIDAERARLPARVFSEQYAGEFVEGSGSVFRGVRELCTGTFADPVPGERYSAGLDLGRHEDYTALVILNRKREVVCIDHFTNTSWPIQVNRILAKTDRYHHARTLIDATGVGDPIFEELRRVGVNVDPYTFSSRSKTALIDNLSLTIEKGQLVLPKPELAPDLVDELESYHFDLGETGGVKMGAPYGQHDDLVTALALGVWQVKVNVPATFRLVSFSSFDEMAAYVNSGGG